MQSSQKRLTPPERWILWGIPALFLIGSIFHFIYELCGKFFLVGLLAPVNESIFEHMKLALLPTLLWWALYPIKHKQGIDKNAWFTAGFISMLVSSLLMPMLYYFYTGAFGVELMVVDIVILLICLCAGQLLGLHFYRHGKGLPFRISLLLMLTLVILFAILTIIPPPLPMFQDPLTGLYGINKLS